jgi:RNA polymerase sigma-70 factor (ECF subfamily)
MRGVAQTAYLAFTAGYAPGSGPDLLRADLAGEAVRLVRVTLALRPGEPVLSALLALMLLQHSRRDARVGPHGALVLLPDQDRGRWHHDEVAEAVALLAEVAPSSDPLVESYRLQGVIAAEHALAPAAEETRWDRICDAYDALARVNPSPAVRLAAAVALAERDGPQAGLDALDGLDDELPASHRVPALRGELLARLGDRVAAAQWFGTAVARCHNEVERAHLESRLASLRP